MLRRWLCRRLCKGQCAFERGDVENLVAAQLRLHWKVSKLALAMERVGHHVSFHRRRNEMASPLLAELEAQVTAATTVVASATLFINGLPALIDAKIAEALANGATAAQLAPFDALGDELKAAADALAAAVAANTTPPTP